MLGFSRRKTLTSKTLFGLDALGALSSTLLLLVVLTHFQSHIGLSYSSIRLLGITAMLLFIFSFACFLLHSRKAGRLLQMLAFLNSSYLVFTGIILWSERMIVTWIGFVYFLAEAVIVALLIKLEYQKGKSLD